MSDPYNNTGPTGAMQDGVSVLQNIARQIGAYAASITNAYPAATTTASPRSLGFNSITTTATAVLSTSAVRHGLLFANPGATATMYVYPTPMTTAPTTAALGGALPIAPGSSLVLSPAMFPNLNAGWSAFSNTGSSQPLTIIEFF